MTRPHAARTNGHYYRGRRKRGRESTGRRAESYAHQDTQACGRATARARGDERHETMKAAIRHFFDSAVVGGVVLGERGASPPAPRPPRATLEIYDFFLHYSLSHTSLASLFTVKLSIRV